VVLVTDEGNEIVLQHPGMFGQAKRAARRFQEELDTDGVDEFARRYGLHLT